MQVQAGGCSDTGQVRAVNQDHYAVRGRRATGGWDALLMVADGMGGHQGGEVASSLAVGHVLQVCESTPLPSADLESTLRRAIVEANATVRRTATTDPALRGMGTTLTAALVRDDQLYVGHVGDSRLYLVRGPSIYQLTQDHSWVAGEVREGRLTTEEAEHHPERHVLTQAVGGAAHVNADTGAYSLENGDVLLLCTDGLSTLVNGQELMELTRDYRQPTIAAEQLIALANHRGAPDNVTAVVARVADGRRDGKSTHEMEVHRRRRPARRGIVAIGGLAGLGLAAGLWTWLQTDGLANVLPHVLGQ
jgi:serine/threonine protein phosphatase PrpC